MAFKSRRGGAVLKEGMITVRFGRQTFSAPQPHLFSFFIDWATRASILESNRFNSGVNTDDLIIG